MIWMGDLSSHRRKRLTLGKSYMKYAWLLPLGLLMTGCSHMLCAAGLDCSDYYLEQLDEMAPLWDQWLGKTKDERIKSEGPPDKCEVLVTGEEVCEWRSGGISGQGSYSAHSGYGQSSSSSWEHRRIFTYDKNHIARAWSYRGSLGIRNSKVNSTSSQ